MLDKIFRGLLLRPLQSFTFPDFPPCKKDTCKFTYSSAQTAKPCKARTLYRCCLKSLLFPRIFLTFSETQVPKPQEFPTPLNLQHVEMTKNIFEHPCVHIMFTLSDGNADESDGRGTGKRRKLCQLRPQDSGGSCTTRQASKVQDCQSTPSPSQPQPFVALADSMFPSTLRLSY